MEEIERSLHDAIMIVRRLFKRDSSIVAGGGAIEVELSNHLRTYAREIKGKEQTIIMAVAKALEIIPRQLCHNAGLDSTLILSKLREKHVNGGMWFGVDIFEGDVADNMEKSVWESAYSKRNALTAAIEAATVILSINETIKNKKPSGELPPGAMPQMMR